MTISNTFKVLALAAAFAGSACVSVDRASGDDARGYWFEGTVYNGVDLTPVADAQVTLSYAGQTIEAPATDDAGHYRVGPLLDHSDFTITIAAGDGYRTFFANEPMKGYMPNAEDETQTQIYDAYLFPTNIAAPDVQFTFTLPDTGAPLAGGGKLRLSPASNSDLDLSNSTPASVAGQTWSNDADRLTPSTVVDIDDNGVASVKGKDLTYGVTYDWTVYSVDGYRYDSGTFTSGWDGDQFITLDRLTETPLVATALSLNETDTNEHAQVVITFNQEIELADYMTQGALANAIDSAFTINSPDANANEEDDPITLLPTAGRNVLVAPDNTGTPRGTSVKVSGHTLTLSWSRKASAFDISDAEDPILSATWNALNLIVLRPVGGRTAQEVALSTLLGATSVTVNVDPAP